MENLSRFFEPVCNIFKKLKISKKSIAIIVLAVFLLSLIPIFVMSFYNAPSYDDYTFARITHAKWMETGSPISVLSASFETVSRYYFNWQGFYTANFVPSLNPFIFNENLYFINTFSVIIVFSLGLFFLVNKILKLYFNADNYDVILITCPALFVFFQFLPSAAEWLYWFDAGQGMIYYGMMFFLIGNLIKCSYYNQVKIGIGTSAVLSVIITIIISGAGDCPTFMLLFLIIKVMYDIINRKSKKLICFNIVLFLITLICFIVCLVAPGNSVRVESSVAGMPFFKAIIMSFFYSFTFISSSNVTIILIAMAIFVSPFVFILVKKSNFKFRYPLFVFIVSYCLYASRFFSTLYTISSIGSTRQRNGYFLTEILLIMVTLFYFMGWVYRKIESVDSKEFKLMSHIKSLSKRYSVLFMLFVIVVSAMGVLQFGVKQTTSISSTLSIVTGEAQQFKSEMDERLNLYLDDEIKNVEVYELTSIPYVFMDDSLKIEWAKQGIANYYSKDSITLIEN